MENYGVIGEDIWEQMSVDTKVCIACEQSKPRTSKYFYKKKARKDGLRERCKQCMREGRYKKELRTEDGTLLKKCTICGGIFPADLLHFYKRSQKKSGLSSWCKNCACTREHNRFKERYKNEAFKEQKRVDANTRNKALKLKVFKHYCRNGVVECACHGCSERNVEFLAIDHINGGGGQHRKQIGVVAGANFHRWLINNGFPEGFRILCHNCNASRGYYGYCPHESPELAGSLRRVTSL